MYTQSDVKGDDQAKKNRVPANGKHNSLLSSPRHTQIHRKVLVPGQVNNKVEKAQYAVRGELYLRGEQLQQEGRQIIFTNVGNPQALGAQPITFVRQVLALCTAPFLMDHPEVTKLFPTDAIQYASMLLKSFKGGLGSYTDSRGCDIVRRHVAEFIEQRDGHECNPEHIFLSNGASSSVQNVLQVVIRDEHDGILTPVPQYPLYSATITLLGGTFVPYLLDEDRNWGFNISALKAQVQAARSAGTTVRALVVINPGNPTGQCLSRSDLEDVIKFCYEERLVLLADEVYQELVYQDERPFYSAKKILMELGEPYSSSVELFSFHSVSKGTVGECGLRGGYMEMVNIHPDTVALFYKVSSIKLCPNTLGQAAVSLMVKPPEVGGESYELYMQERERELASLRRRAHKVTDSFQALPKMSCNFTEGAMYSFPRIHLPAAAVVAARQAGKAPDVYYCLKLLEATGISTVPGSGFGQADGTYHFRTTILPREEVMENFVEMFRQFHMDFIRYYSGCENGHGGGENGHLNGGCQNGHANGHEDIHQNGY